MSISIPREAVEAAARVTHRNFDNGSVLVRHLAREEALEILNPAAPLIVAAELDRMAIVQSKEARDCPCGGGDEQGPYCCSIAHAQAARRLVEYRERATELRGGA